MSTLLRSLTLAGLLLWCELAAAHTSGSSFVSVRSYHSGYLEADLDFDLRDLHQLLQLDQDHDGALSWGEIRSTQDAIESLVLTKIRFIAKGQACTVASRKPLMIAPHGTGPYARLSLTLICATGTHFQIDYSRWFPFDPGHRALLEFVGVDGERTQTILSQSNPLWQPQESRIDRLHRFLVEGAIHLITGYDHLAFLAVLLLALARRTQPNSRNTLRSMLRGAFAVITAFTIAHSVTLALAATGRLVLPSKPVEVAIAASVLIAALLNLWRGAGEHGWKFAFVFGLVHGLGFAGALAELTAEHIDLLALASFNLGIETAQILIAATVVPIMWWFFGNQHRERIGIPVASILVASLAALWVVDRITAT